MSYQLKHRETLGENLRRVCRQQIEWAIAIAKGEKKPNDTPVHETRKHLKKTRAALRLVRKEIAFQNADRNERAMKLRLPISLGNRETGHNRARK